MIRCIQFSLINQSNRNSIIADFGSMRSNFKRFNRVILSLLDYVFNIFLNNLVKISIPRKLLSFQSNITDGVQA